MMMITIMKYVEVPPTFPEISTHSLSYLSVLKEMRKISDAINGKVHKVHQREIMIFTRKMEMVLLFSMLTIAQYYYHIHSHVLSRDNLIRHLISICVFVITYFLDIPKMKDRYNYHCHLVCIFHHNYTGIRNLTPET
jgi:hypothetical protein